MKLYNIFFYTLYFIFFIPFISCKSEDQGNVPVPVSVEVQSDSASFEEIKKLNKEIHDLFLKWDYDEILKYFSDDALLLPPMLPEIRGKAALREHYKKQDKILDRVSASGGTIEKMWSSENLVYEYGTYGFTAKLKDHNKPFGQTGHYFMIWEKQKDGSFLIKYIIENLDYNPCN